MSNSKGSIGGTALVVLVLAIIGFFALLAWVIPG